MPDRLTPEQRLRCMRANKSKGTRPEQMLCHELWHRGLRYRRNVRGVAGTPDICFKERKVAVFVDGEFWHGRNWAEAKMRIKSNQEFWYRKIERNMARDSRNTLLLQQQGWEVLRFWDSEVRADVAQCADKVEAVLRQRDLLALHRSYRYDTRFDDLDIDYAAEEDLNYDDPIIP